MYGLQHMSTLLCVHLRHGIYSACYLGCRSDGVVLKQMQQHMGGMMKTHWALNALL